jgi:hypothetical protein
MPKLTLNHFEFSILFAILSSIVLGIITKKTDQERVRYAVKCFAWYVVSLFGIGWLMYLGHR